MPKKHKDYDMLITERPGKFTPLTEIRTYADNLDRQNRSGWVDLIADYYLNEREKKMLHALSAYVSCSRRQRELGVLLGQPQPNVCIRLQWLKRKIARLYYYLSSDSLFDEYDSVLSDGVVTHKQHHVLGLYLAGNSLLCIASLFDVSYTNITLLRGRCTEALDSAGNYGLLAGFMHESKYNFKYTEMHHGAAPSTSN